jgi:hypothetical protein
MASSVMIFDEVRFLSQYSQYAEMSPLLMPNMGCYAELEIPYINSWTLKIERRDRRE